MRAQVLDALRDIEARHDVTVLFACESGSRGWGFASPDSDYDVRFIYVNRLPWYLTVTPGRDVIEVPISGDLDINGWDLRKALGLMRESNPTLLEWLRSPIVYREEADTMAQFRALAAQVFSNAKGWHHYASMAKKNFREHLQADEVRYKKYLYVLRPLLAARWIRTQPGVPPMRFAELGCCRFQRHLVKVEDETGGGSWREEGHSAESSSSRRSSWSPSVAWLWPRRPKTWTFTRACCASGFVSCEMSRRRRSLATASKRPRTRR